MRPYLVFALYGPLAAFGAVAVGERRAGAARPARSAVLGLIGAALGIERADAPAQAALESGYGVAVRVDAAGVVLSDYHTAQVPPARRGQHHTTRRQELDAGPLETILSRREYRTDTLFTVGLWERDTPPFPLATLKTALECPVFTLSVGRKSCPLGLPPAPVLTEAEDVLLAMASRVPPKPEARIRYQLRARPLLLATDLDGRIGSNALSRIEQRRDAVHSRDRWQFTLRQEAVFDLGAQA